MFNFNSFTLLLILLLFTVLASATSYLHFAIISELVWVCLFCNIGLSCVLAPSVVISGAPLLVLSVLAVEAAVFWTISLGTFFKG